MFIDAHSHIFQELYTSGSSPPKVQLKGVEIYSREKLPESVNELETINIEKFLKNKSVVKEYGKNSYRLYRENYSEEIFYREYMKVLESITI